jgi:hypothetical protein
MFINSTETLRQALSAAGTPAPANIDAVRWYRVLGSEGRARVVTTSEDLADWLDSLDAE